MGKRREVRVKAVGKPTRGMFKGELMPNEWLSSVDEIAEKWARRSFLQPAAAFIPFFGEVFAVLESQVCTWSSMYGILSHGVPFLG